MSRPLSTIMWCPAVQVGTRWQLCVHFMRGTRRDCEREFVQTGTIIRPQKFVKVRIQEVQGAGYSPSKREKE